MLQIVKKDNDDTFTENLAKKSGRTLMKRDESQGMRKFVSTVQVNPDEVYDRTSPQRVGPRGFYSSSLNQNSSALLNLSGSMPDSGSIGVKT